MSNEVINSNDKDANQWGMFVHFSMLAGFVIPFAGLILPIVLWQMKKKEFPIVDQHGKTVVNWMISAFIYGIVCSILMVIVVGFFGLIALAIASIVFAIMGGIKANDGEVWEYPLSIKFLK